MDATNLLLKMSKDDFKKSEKVLEIKRLSTEKEKFEITIQEINDTTLYSIREMCKKENGTIDRNELQLQTLLQGIVKPDFKNQELLSHFKVATPFDLLKLIFNIGERQEIADKIMELIGFGDEDNVKELKN